MFYFSDLLLLPLDRCDIGALNTCMSYERTQWTWLKCIAPFTRCNLMHIKYVQILCLNWQIKSRQVDIIHRNPLHICFKIHGPFTSYWHMRQWNNKMLLLHAIMTKPFRLYLWFSLRIYPYSCYVREQYIPIMFFLIGHIKFAIKLFGKMGAPHFWLSITGK